MTGEYIVEIRFHAADIGAADSAARLMLDTVRTLGLSENPLIAYCPLESADRHTETLSIAMRDGATVLFEGGGDTIERAKADDPKLLRARIAELEKREKAHVAEVERLRREIPPRLWTEIDAARDKILSAHKLLTELREWAPEAMPAAVVHEQQELISGDRSGWFPDPAFTEK